METDDSYIIKYSRKKEEIVRHIKKVVRLSEKKLKGCQIGDSLENLVENIGSTDQLKTKDLFLKNMNMFLKIRWRRKFTQEELDLIWNLHAVHTGQEISGIVKDLKESLDICLGSDIQNDALRKILHEQLNALKDNRPKALISMIEHEMRLLSLRMSRRRFMSHVFKAGAHFLLPMQTAKLLAESINAILPQDRSLSQALLDYTKDVHLNISYDWKDPRHLTKKVGKENVQQLLSIAIRMAWKMLKNSKANKPDNIPVCIASDVQIDQLKGKDAAYDPVTNLIYMNSNWIRHVVAMDRRVYIFFGFMLHESVHFIDYNSVKKGLENERIVISWAEQRSQPSSLQELSERLKMFVEFSKYSERRAMRYQKEFLGEVLNRMTKKADISLFKTAIEAVDNNLRKLEHDRYGIVETANNIYRMYENIER